MLAGVAALLVLAVIAGAVALDQRGNARAEATAADAQRLGAQALADDDLDRALLLARQGVALDDTLQTRGNLLAALLKSPAAIGVLGGDGDRLVSLDLSPDGRTLAFVDNGGPLSFARPRHAASGGPPRPSRFGAGRRGGCRRGSATTARGSRSAATQPVVLDARTHRVLARWPSTGSPSRACASPRTDARWSPPFTCPRRRADRPALRRAQRPATRAERTSPRRPVSR